MWLFPSVCTHYKTRHDINRCWSNLIATNDTKNCPGISVLIYIEVSYRPLYMRFCTNFDGTSKIINRGGKKLRGNREKRSAFFNTFSVRLPTQYTELRDVDTDLRQVGIAKNAAMPSATRNWSDKRYSSDKIRTRYFYLWDEWVYFKVSMGHICTLPTSIISKHKFHNLFMDCFTRLSRSQFSNNRTGEW